VASAANAYAKAQCPPWADSVLVSGVSSDADWVLICAGDTPAINPQTIRDFIQAVMGSGRGLGVIGMVMNEPKGYGRMLKTPEGALRGIVEERDADAATKQITLCNSGVIFAKTDLLFGLLKDLSPNNAQGEYYLTDIFSQAVKLGHPAYIFETPQELEFQGVNDRLQLAQVETMMLRQRLASLMSHGVTIRLPETVYVEADVVIEPDVTLDPGVQIKGKTRISRNCIIGAQVVLEDAQLGAGVRVGAHAVVTRSSVKSLATIPAQACLADRDI
jgi:bifunctional UDP-N-acetylglucosamine pyrophosphorylase/glucosamine-1-phosphate N-acetyltransferase